MRASALQRILDMADADENGCAYVLHIALRNGNGLADVAVVGLSRNDEILHGKISTEGSEPRAHDIFIDVKEITVVTLEFE